MKEGFKQDWLSDDEKARVKREAKPLPNTKPYTWAPPREEIKLGNFGGEGDTGILPTDQHPAFREQREELARFTIEEGEKSLKRAMDIVKSLATEAPLTLAILGKFLSGERKISEYKWTDINSEDKERIGKLIHVGGFDDPKPGELGASSSRIE